MTAIKDKVSSFKDGLIHGMGWAFGVTIGFLILSAVLLFVANSLGGIPIIGDAVRGLIQTTTSTQSNYTHSPQIPQ